MRSASRVAEPRRTIQTPRLLATITTEGYVSGVASLVDQATGTRDLGFGLAIADFLLEPAPNPDEVIPEGQYDFGPENPWHGNIPKRYVEGPQICTQAGTLPVEVTRGEGFTVARQRYRWHQAYAPHERAGSVWEQTLVFPDAERFFLVADRVTTVNTSPALFLRVDMPGHLRHDQGDRFEHVYLSYNDPPFLPSTEFQVDFPPDARGLYQRPQEPDQFPERFMRGYQTRIEEGKPGPWLASLTLDPADVHEAWCHQRGYVCMILEIGGRPTVPGTTFGACHAVGWFDSPRDMEATHDRLGRASGIALDGSEDRPTAYRLIGREQLTPIEGWDADTGKS